MGSGHRGAVLLERDAALSSLHAAFGAVVAGRGGVALVSGEAGIGKSSLVRAFVAAERRATRVLAGACDDLAVPHPLHRANLSRAEGPPPYAGGPSASHLR